MASADVVDPERLLARLERARTEIEQLRGQAALGADALMTDPLQLDAAKYRLIVAVEACIDAAEHVIASERLRRPTSFSDAFTVLAEAGLLTEPTAAAARLMAGMRNVLVHGYAVVEDDRVVDAILHRLHELDRLRAELAAVAV